MKQTLLILSIIFSLNSLSQSTPKTFIINDEMGGKYLEVMQEDLGQMTWYDALKTCAELGDGWRLPTKYELENDLYKNKDKIGGFKEESMDKYWSATQCGDGGYGELGHAWIMSFGIGSAEDGYNAGHTAYRYLYNVRAVRHVEK
jgi:hypothetical protein